MIEPNHISFAIVPFAPQYRDDMIFCLLAAKNALGGVPRLNDDLLDIPTYYLARSEGFWLALSGGRVIGLVGTCTESKEDLWLKRLYVHPAQKRQGVASALLRAVEVFAREKGVRNIHARCNEDYAEAARFYPAMGFVEAERSSGLRHFVKELELGAST
jgi:GNAT superfamily N-acetyltransferase